MDKAIRIGSGLVGRGVLEDMFVRLTVSRCFGRAEDTLAENWGKDLTQRDGKRHRGRRERKSEEEPKKGEPKKEGFITQNTRNGAEFLTPKTPFGMTCVA